MAYVRSPRICGHFEKIRNLFTVEETIRWLQSPAAKIEWMLKNSKKLEHDYDHYFADCIQSLRRGNEASLYKPPVNKQFSLLQYQRGWITMLLDMSWRVEIACDEAFFLVGDEPMCA